MLDVVFDRNKCSRDPIFYPDFYFTFYKRQEWFTDPFVKDFISVIDGSTILFEEAVCNKFGHGISTENISTSCKLLCDLYFDRTRRIFSGADLTANCIPFLMKIASIRNICMLFEDFVDLDEKYFYDGLISMNNKIITYEEYVDAFVSYVKEKV